MPKSLLALALLVVTPVLAQAPDDVPPIQDNSFLIEEAYNQEMGVVQHISTWQQDRDSHDWSSTFTQEWPFLSPKHQLSYTLEWDHAAGVFGDEGSGGLGDLAINYRYQLIGDGNAPVAFSPRLTLLVPTGDARKGRGAGEAGLQVNLPLSVVVSPRLAAHTNVGFTWTPNAENEIGDKADNFSPQLGQSLVWLVNPRVNLMLEAVYANEESTVSPGRTEKTNSFTISPGIRWSHNFASGLQIVPGIAFPIGVGPSDGDKAVFLYLSFEHPFGKGK
ncbi:MAG TPA: transporter [Thermoanaerobaculia bacterium]|nr:transporter [Thermoanaerobaculia bacterium]